DREQLVDLDAGARFLPGLAAGTGCGRLMQLEKTRRQRPEAAPRFDRPPAQQDALLPGGDGADHNLGILVVDEAAVAADEAAAVVALGHAALEALQRHGRAALRILGNSHRSTVAQPRKADKTAAKGTRKKGGGCALRRAGRRGCRAAACGRRRSRRRRVLRSWRRVLPAPRRAWSRPRGRPDRRAPSRWREKGAPALG